MIISEKLRLIKEGFSIEEMTHENIFHAINENTINNFSIIFENYFDELLVENTLSVTKNSNDNNDDRSFIKKLVEKVKKIFQWLKDKMIQFIKFIKSKIFNQEKNIEEILKTSLDILELSRRKGFNLEVKNVIIAGRFDIFNNFYFDKLFPKRYVTILDHLKGIAENIEKNLFMSNDINLISNEKKKEFLDKIFKEKFKIRYDDAEIMDFLYGKKVKILASTINIDSAVKSVKLMLEKYKLLEEWYQNTLNEIKEVEQRVLKEIETIDSINKVNIARENLMKIIAVHNLIIQVINKFMFLHETALNNIAHSLDKMNKIIMKSRIIK